jgi:hypothetical protein
MLIEKVNVAYRTEDGILHSTFQDAYNHENIVLKQEAAQEILRIAKWDQYKGPTNEKRINDFIVKLESHGWVFSAKKR